MKKKVILSLIVYCAIGTLTAMSQLVINELMQSNIDCLMDDMREFPDSWVELYNAGSEAINLGDYRLGLSEDVAEAWLIPAVQLAPHAHHLIYCDREDRGRHTPFRLESGKGGSVYLFKGATVVDCVTKLAKQPAPNIAYGRETDGGDVWGYQAISTPGNANCGRLVNQLLDAPVFSRSGHVFTAGQHVELTLSLPDGVPAQTQIRYTLDGSEPDARSSLYTVPISFDTTTIVRAVLVCDGYLSPRSTTHSYIFHQREQAMPVVSLVSDNDYFFGEDNGLLTLGEIEVTPSGDLRFPNFYYLWRRPVNIEYFPVDSQTSVINQLGETRILGHSSRQYSLKSLVVYANKRFGTKRMNYEFFPEQKPGKDKFKSIILRNSGNDFTSLYMRDAIIQRSMATYSDIDWQAWQPTSVYINGKYYGMLNLRERSNAANIETNYGSEVSDSIDMVESWGGEIKEGDASHWDEFVSFYSVEGHALAEYEQRVDMAEFNNIMAMNLYFNNYDFPGNNCVWWRPTQAGGRWRIIAKDCDFGMGLDNIAPDFPILEWFYNPGYARQNGITLGAYGSNEWKYTVMFRNLMKNAEYRRRFTDLMAIYMGDFLNAEGVRKVWDPMYEQVKAEIPYHLAAIPYYWERSNYAASLSYAREWIEQRTDFMYSHLSSFYQLGKPVPLTINQLGEQEQQNVVRISINGVPLRKASFDGKMFARRDIKVEAQSELVSIKGWQMTVTGADGRSTVTRIDSNECSFAMPADGHVSLDVILDGRSDVPGDVNGDGVVDVQDVNMAINVMLGKVNDSGDELATDVNGDGVTDVVDINAIVNYMLNRR